MRFYNGFALINRIVDGDTFESTIEAWPTVYYGGTGYGRIRLVHKDGSKYDAPEIRTDAGKRAKAYATELLAGLPTVEVGCIGIDSFGRSLCSVTLPDGRDMAAVMTEAGHVKGKAMTERTFDRRYEYDPRSAHYRMSLLWSNGAASFSSIETQAINLIAPIKNKLWDLDVQLDQGREGACVGFGFSQEAAAAPEVVSGVDNAYALAWYNRAKQLDPWPGEDYDGTSTLAGAKVGVEKGNYISYLWAQSEDEVARTVSNYGPVVIGVNWYSGMMETDADGFIHVMGSVQGGHCIVVIGIDAVRGYYILQNSWGDAWGDSGRCYLSRADLAVLLANDGDACVLTRVHIAPPTPPDPVPVAKCSTWDKLLNWLSGNGFVCPGKGA
jgi:hypothetical protein